MRVVCDVLVIDCEMLYDLVCLCVVCDVLCDVVGFAVVVFVWCLSAWGVDCACMCCL